MTAVHYFILGAIISISFMAGFFPSKKGTRIFMVVLAAGFALIIAKTSEQHTSDTIHLLLALGIFALPTFIGGIFRHLVNNVPDVNEDGKELAEMRSIEIVQKVDDILNCVVGVNNQWVKNNSSSLEDAEKIKFVQEHREILNTELKSVHNCQEIIQLLQHIKRGISTPRNAS